MPRHIALIALLLPLVAAADIYKCRLPGGKMEISNSPCPAGSGTIAARPDENIPEAARQQAEKDVERMRSYVDKREAAQRADEAAAREERANQRQAATGNMPVRPYGDPDTCLRTLEQQALEATQRAQLEAECRNLAKPPNASPAIVPIIIGAPHGHHPRHPKPAKPPEPSAPTIAICLPANKNCQR